MNHMVLTGVFHLPNYLKLETFRAAKPLYWPRKDLRASAGNDRALSHTLSAAICQQCVAQEPTSGSSGRAGVPA